MILIFALLLALVLGIVRGGNVSNLQHLHLRGYGIVLGAVALQSAVIYLPTQTNIPLRVAVLGISFGLVALFIWLNRNLPGMPLIGVGFLANLLVMMANGGHMPITYEAVVAAGYGRLASPDATGMLIFGSKDILLPAEQTRLGFLSDIFVIPPPFPITSVFSVGDVLIALGMFWLVPSALGARTVAPLRTH
jgi:hypothetical protein